MLYIQKVPWPHHLSTTERALTSSRLVLQAIQWPPRRPVYFFLFVQQDKKSLEESTSLEETFFLTIFGNKLMKKVRSEWDLHQNALLYTLLNLIFNSSDMRHFEARSTR